MQDKCFEERERGKNRWEEQVIRDTMSMGNEVWRDQMKNLNDWRHIVENVETHRHF